MRNVYCPKIDGLTQEKGNKFSSMLTNLPSQEQGCIIEKLEIGARGIPWCKIDSPAGLGSTLLIGLVKPLEVFEAHCFVFPATLL